MSSERTLSPEPNEVQTMALPRTVLRRLCLEVYERGKLRVDDRSNTCVYWKEALETTEMKLNKQLRWWALVLHERVL